MTERQRSPAFQHYPADFETATQAMTLEEAGAYARLYNACWTQPEIAFDFVRMATIARTTPRKMAKIWAVIGPLFLVRDDRVAHPHIQRERAKQEATREQKKLAADARWHPGTGPNARAESGAPPPGHSETDARAYADALQTECGEVCGDDALQASTSSLIETASASDARRTWPDVAAALEPASEPKLLEDFLATVRGDARTYLGLVQRALGMGGKALPPDEVARTVSQYLSNLRTGTERALNRSRFEAYLGAAQRRLREGERAPPVIGTRPPRNGRTPPQRYDYAATTKPEDVKWQDS